MRVIEIEEAKVRCITARFTNKEYEQIGICCKRLQSKPAELVGSIVRSWLKKSAKSVDKYVQKHGITSGKGGEKKGKKTRW